MAKLDVLITQLDAQIGYYDRESTKHKRLYRRLRYGVFGLTAVSTVLASIAAAVATGPYVQLAVVIVTAAIGVLTSIEGMRKPAELWLHERALYHALEDLRRELEFRREGKLDDAAIDDGFARLQGVLSAGSTKWQQHIMQPAPAADRRAAATS